MTELITQLEAIVGSANVLNPEQVAQRAKHFWDPSPMVALALVRPADTNEVSQVLKICSEHKQPVVTHGGVTGLVDGEKSNHKEIILSLERMQSIESIDPVNRTMTVQAGCVLQTVHEAATDAGLFYGLDLGARGSCTIGGNISTNAGGLSVLRYGMTREQILGLEVVLADGTILSSLNKMIKNNAGYDLKQLFIGSEGTLGVVTRAVLRLRPDTPTCNTAIVAFDNFDQVTATLDHITRTLNTNLNAFEILWNDFYHLSTNPDINGSTRAPLANDSFAYAIIEARGANEASDQQLFIQAMEAAIENALIADAVIAKSESERAEIWNIRENVDLTLRHQPLFIYDISLPINHMQTYLDEVRSTLQKDWPEVIVYAYGHLADNNLHVTIAPQPKNYINDPQQQPVKIQAFNDTQRVWYEQCNKTVFEPLAKLGGSISAEHGIGLLKKQYLKYSRTPEEIRVMQLLKKSLDPHNLLNPGKVC